jgi:hypothetical protein
MVTGAARRWRSRWARSSTASSGRGCACGASLACVSATCMISLVMPWILMSICRAVMPLSVPATLKSMSPRWSSSPRMSVSTAKRLPSLIRPMAMPATCAFSGTPASISASEPPQTEAIDGAVRLGDLRDDAHRVAELLGRGQHGQQRALGQAAVADLAALRRTDAAGLAGGEGRHVVVEHEAVAVLALQRVDDLLVAAGAQRGHHQRLRLAAGEQRRAVGARQHAGADRDRAHGARVAAVDARLAVEDLVADDLRLEVEEDVA